MSLLYDNLQSIGEKDVKTEERASRDLRDLIGKFVFSFVLFSFLFFLFCLFCFVWFVFVCF